MYIVVGTIWDVTMYYSESKGLVKSNWTNKKEDADTFENKEYAEYIAYKNRIVHTKVEEI